MATVIITAEDAYRKFLQGIRKVANRTVTPTEFDSWFNDATMDWLRQKLPMGEFNQKRQDDLSRFIVLTDGSDAIAGVDNIFNLPSVYTATTNGRLMSGGRYLYLYGLSVTFLDIDSLEEFSASLKRSENRDVMLWSPYRKVTKKRPYFQRIGDTIRLYGRDASSMILEYYRYPSLVSYTDSIKPETNPAQSEEIVQIAVRLFLENRGDPRYKSKLQEMMVTQQGK